MSIKFLYSSEKTNSFRPVPWHWSGSPFPAYRGEGARHRGFLAVAREYTPSFVDAAPTADGYNCSRLGFDPTATKLIRTREKNTLLLVTCSPEQDEQIMMVTLRGGFRGDYSRVKVRGGEILVQNSSNKHCCPTAHLIVRLTHPNGFVFAETGRRCSTGLVEIFSWDGYKTMPTEEFETWLSSQSPDITDNTKTDAKAKAEADRKVAVVRARQQQQERDAKAKAEAEAERQRKVNAERMKPILESRLTILSERRQAIGLGAITLDTESFCYSESSWNRHEYTETNLKKIEAEVVVEEDKYAGKKAFEVGLEELRLRLAAAKVTFCDDRGALYAKAESHRYAKRFRYTSEGLEELRTFLNAVEEEVAEARRQAEAKAEVERQVAEAIELGLPSEVEIWHRRGASTKLGDGWVMRSDGTLRSHDGFRRYGGRDGHKKWTQILPGEVVLRWAKAYTAADHEFEVVHLPTEGLTRAQLEHIAEIEVELAEAHDGTSGFSSGIPSPSVGVGWGLRVQPPEPAGKEESAGTATLADLMAKFNKN